MTEIDLTPTGTTNKPIYQFRFFGWIVLIGVLATAGLVHIINQPMPVAEPLLSTYDVQEAHLNRLMHCESSGNGYAQGDAGESNGWYQWKKPSLEHVMGVHNGEKIELTWEQYWNIVTNYEEAHYWTRYAYYDLNLQRWWLGSHIRMAKGEC